MLVPCHHGKARPPVADGGESLQIWRVAANILNKQSRTADKGWSSSLGVGVGLTTPHCTEVICYEMFQSARPKQLKKDMIFGTLGTGGSMGQTGFVWLSGGLL
jgi:hypothetical protein